jgi:hypothetical protein
VVAFGLTVQHSTSVAGIAWQAHWIFAADDDRWHGAKYRPIFAGSWIPGWIAAANAQGARPIVSRPRAMRDLAVESGAELSAGRLNASRSRVPFMTIHLVVLMSRIRTDAGAEH